MKAVINNALVLFLISLLLGCGSSYSLVPVSGTVTVDGKPTSGIKLYLSPVAVGGNVDSGPHSTGLTDENGGFVLECRYGDAGAVVGKHKAVLSYADPSAAKRALTTPEAEKLRKELQAMRRARNIRENKEDEKLTPVIVEVTVPSDGTETLKIELITRKK